MVWKGAKIDENDVNWANYGRWGLQCLNWKDEGLAMQFIKDFSCTKYGSGGPS